MFTLYCDVKTFEPALSPVTRNVAEHLSVPPEPFVLACSAKASEDATVVAPEIANPMKAFAVSTLVVNDVYTETNAIPLAEIVIVTTGPAVARAV